MEVLAFDLYQFFHLPRPAGASGGQLRVWAVGTDPKVSLRRRRPVVLILPGGAYRWTSPREAEPVALRFLARGFLPCVLDYSCAPCAFPTALREAAMAMRLLRDQAHCWEGNARRVAALGFSAGGHLCGTLGTLYDAPEVADIGPADTLRPDALGLCYPVAVSWGRTHTESFGNLSGGDSSLAQRLSLDRLVRQDMPPVFLWHTRDDPSVPARNSLVLAQALEEAGVDFALHIYRHGQHGLSTADEMVYPASSVPAVSWDVPGWVETMIRFLAELGFHIEDEGGTA